MRPEIRTRRGGTSGSAWRLAAAALAGATAQAAFAQLFPWLDHHPLPTPSCPLLPLPLRRDLQPPLKPLPLPPQPRPEEDHTSSHRCLHGQAPEVWGPASDRAGFSPTQWKARICVFRGLVLDSRSWPAEFVYRELPEEGERDDASPPTDYVRGRPVSLAEVAKDLKAALFRERSFRLGPRMVVPATLPSPPGAAVVLINNKCSRQMGGHVLADEVLPHFHAMLDAGLTATNNLVVLLRKCTREGGWVPGTPYRQHPYFSLLSSEPVRFLDDLALETNGTLMVIPLLLVGDTGRRLYSPSLSSSFVARVFRDFVYGVHGLPTTKVAHDAAAGGVLRVGVLSKAARHRFLNHHALVSTLREFCTHSMCIVEDFSPDQDFTHPGSEVRLMSTLDVLVSPGGGSSFGVLLMRDFTVAVLGAVCWPGAPLSRAASNGFREFAVNGTVTHCVRPDGFLFDMLSHTLVLHYVPSLPQTELLFDGFAPGEHKAEHFDFSYTVDVAAMVRLVARGMAWVRGNSQSMPG